MRSRELPFRLATGAFALVVALLVLAVGFELSRQSWLSVQKFGFEFWRTSRWDPVAGEYGALPFIWGTLYSAVLALVIATPIALGIAVFISELCPAPLRTHRHCRRRDARVRQGARRNDGGDDGDRQQPAGVDVAICAAVHDGRCHR